MLCFLLSRVKTNLSQLKFFFYLILVLFRWSSLVALPHSELTKKHCFWYASVVHSSHMI